MCIRDSTVTSEGGVGLGSNLTAGTIRLGGELGSHVIQERVTGIVNGPQVGNAVTNATVTTDGSADIIHTTTFPAGLVDRSDYVFRVTAGISVLTEGDYLAEYRATAFSGNPIWFNFRRITDNTAAAVNLDFPSSAIFTGFGYTVFEMEMGSRGLQILDTSQDPDQVLLMDSAGGVFDFSQYPTVNGGSIVPNNGIDTDQLADDAVTGPKIANDSVGEGHLVFSNGTTELPGRVITYGTGGLSTIADPVPAIGQNTGNIVNNENRINALTTRLGNLEDEVHRIEDASTRATTNFYRSVTGFTSPPSDTLVDYTTVGGTTRNWTLTSSQGGTATFRQGSVALDSDIDQHTTSHISDIYNHELPGGTYRRTETGGVTSGQIDYTGAFITPIATMELVVNGQTLRIPLRISHDTQGRIITHLHDPWPVTVDLDYTSYTITYRYICLLYTSPSPRDS